MKTNHQQGFKARTQKPAHYITFSGTAICLDEKIISSVSTCSNLEPTGNRRDRKGAKKFLHSRRRRHDRDYLKQLIT